MAFSFRDGQLKGTHLRRGVVGFWNGRFIRYQRHTGRRYMDTAWILDDDDQRRKYDSGAKQERSTRLDWSEV